MPKIHYEVEVVGGSYDRDHILFGPACGYDAHGKLTDDLNKVTCAECRKLCGIQPDMALSPDAKAIPAALSA